MSITSFLNYQTLSWPSYNFYDKVFPLSNYCFRYFKQLGASVFPLFSQLLKSHINLIQESPLNRSPILPQHSFKKIEKDVVTLVSFNGGGVRGFTASKIAAKISEAIARQNSSSYQTFQDQFDCVVGTSIGGFLGCGYAAMKDSTNPQSGPLYTPSEIVDLFDTETSQIFPKPFGGVLGDVVTTFKHALFPKYHASTIEESMRRVFTDHYFGESCMKLMVTAYDTTNARPYIFDSLRPDHACLKMSEIARITTAAPSYFSPKKIFLEGKEISFIDGGIAYPNPSLRAYLWAQEHFSFKKLVICSIGTGDCNSGFDPGHYGFLQWLPSLPDCYTTASIKSVHETLLGLSRGNERLDYFQFDPSFHSDFSVIDNSCRNHMGRLSDATDAYMEGDSFKDELRNFLKIYEVD